MSDPHTVRTECWSRFRQCVFPAGGYGAFHEAVALPVFARCESVALADAFSRPRPVRQHPAPPIEIVHAKTSTDTVPCTWPVTSAQHPGRSPITDSAWSRARASNPPRSNTRRRPGWWPPVRQVGLVSSSRSHSPSAQGKCQVRFARPQVPLGFSSMDRLGGAFDGWWEFRSRVGGGRRQICQSFGRSSPTSSSSPGSTSATSESSDVSTKSLSSRLRISRAG